MSGFPIWMMSRKRQRSWSCSPVDTGDVECVDDLAESGEVVLGQGFFEVVDATVVFEGTALLDGGWYGVSVVGVETEVDVVWQEVSDEFEYGEVVGGVGVLSVVLPVHADLEGFVSGVPSVHDVVEHLVGGLSSSLIRRSSIGGFRVWLRRP